MNNKKEQIYLAALLHDIGKFYERAIPDVKNPDIESLRYANLMGLREVANPLSSKENEILELADFFAQSDAKTKDESSLSYKPLLSVFSNVFENSSNKKYIPVQEVGLDKIPQLNSLQIESNSKEYEDLWQGFINEYKELTDVKSIKYFAETLLKLLEKYTAYIPGENCNNESTDISLFDKSKTRAAFAIAIYNFIKETNNNIEVEKEKPFILIGADLSGIQDFIYDIIGKNASNNLKGRSFFIQILMESVVRLMLRDLGLYKANVVYSAGGNFYMIAQNTNETILKLNKLTTKINKALADAYRRKLYLALDYTEFGKKDLIDEGRLGEIWEELISVKLEKKKKQRYLNELDEKFFQPLDLAKETLLLDKDSVTGELILKNENKEAIDGKTVRYSTYKQIQLGKLLRESDYWVISFDKHPNMDDKNIINPFDEKFMNDKENAIGIYNYFLPHSPDLFDDAEIIRLNKLRFFDRTHKGNIQGFDYYGGNKFPVYNKIDEEKKNQAVKAGDIKQFDDLAQGTNLNRLGILRMDVDNLGKIFALGFKKEMRTFSRLTTLSRSLDWFFTGYLNTIWKEFEDDTIIIYSGGDDLFIVGRWDKTVQFAEKIKDDFKKWTCENPGLTLSGGVAIVTGKFPILKAATMAGEYEEEAKGHSISKEDCINISKNAFTLFGEPLNWEYEFPVVKEIREKIIDFSKKNAPKSFARILVQFQMIREKQRDQNEKYKEGKTDKRVNESWYWMILYYLKRFAENHRKDNTELSLYAELVQKDILANTYKGETLFFLNKSNHILNYYALAARWAELELRTNE